MRSMVAPKKLKSCPQCGSDNIYYDKEKDELICRECGLIFAEVAGEKKKKRRR